MDATEYHARLRYLQSLPPESLLRELLAMIHRDGGQTTAEVGLHRAALLAETTWVRLIQKAEAMDEIADVVKGLKALKGEVK